MSVEEENVLILHKDITKLLRLVTEIAGLPYFGKSVGVCKRLMADNKGGSALGGCSLKLAVNKGKLLVGDIRPFKDLLFGTHYNERIAVDVIGIKAFALCVNAEVLLNLIHDNGLVLFVGVADIVIARCKNEVFGNGLPVKNLEEVFIFAVNAQFGKVAGNDNGVEPFPGI